MGEGTRHHARCVLGGFARLFTPVPVFFLLRFPLTQQVFYSSQVAPRALHVRVHFNGLVEESLRRLQVPRRARLVLEPPVMVGHNRLARRLGLL